MGATVFQNFNPSLHILLCLILLKFGSSSQNVTVEVSPNKYAIEETLRPLRIFVRDLAKEVTLTCTGNCPVEWSLLNYPSDAFLTEPKKSIEFGSSRKFRDFKNVSSYKYAATVTLKGMTNKLTGNYTCECANAARKNNQINGDFKSIFVYWEGSSQSYLLQAGESRTVSKKGSSPWVQILCGVSKPFYPVYLFYNDTLLKPDNFSVIQDDIGFNLNLETIYKNYELSPDPGDPVFYCSLRNRLILKRSRSNSDVVKWTVLEHPKLKEHIIFKHFDSITEESKGLVHYDLSSNTLICCSEGKKHRQVGFYCRNHQECKLYFNRLSSGNNAPSQNETCSSYTEGFETKDGAVVFRCDVPDEIEAQAEKFYGLNSNAYYSIEDAEVEKWNLIELKETTPLSELFYSGSVKYVCRHSSYLFSKGLVWMLVYANGTQVILNETDSDQAPAKDYKVDGIGTSKDGREDWINLRVFYPNVKQLVCLAPLWNSYEWWNSTLNFHLQESYPPQFDSPSDEEIQATTSSIKLPCAATGYPRPSIIWTKDGKNITNGTAKEAKGLKRTTPTNLSNSFAHPSHVGLSLSLEIYGTSLGNYICTARSDVGEVSKTFFVKEKDSTVAKVVGITAGVILFLVLVLGVSLLKIAQQHKCIQYLSTKEIEEFEQGNPEALARFNSENDYTNNAHHFLPYNADYEVPKEQLIIDHSHILGQGTYGMVLKGKLKRAGGEEIDIAVKTVKPNEDASNFKVLLCEVKIMAYIGRHPNILSLLGAFTRNIRNRELLVATEYCENGNIQDFLRKGRTDYRDIFSTSSQNAWQAVSGYSNVTLQITTLDLLKWSGEIATGMDYLGFKRVIHADLACRNVLLTLGRVAKVGDFGLSKHLFHYSTYQKQTVQLLPWKWMAPESLIDMTFSLQTDVWAFGVTLWEIFTLAQSPYPGMVWDTQFLDKLNEGYRLPRPTFANREIYERVIMPCWSTEPYKRPGFSQLKAQIAELVAQFSVN